MVGWLQAARGGSMSRKLILAACCSHKGLPSYTACSGGFEIKIDRYMPLTMMMHSPASCGSSTRVSQRNVIQFDTT